MKYPTSEEEEKINRAIAKYAGTPWKKPDHGPCCTCQTCGWFNDDCKCQYTNDECEIEEVVDRLQREGLMNIYAFALVKEIFGYDHATMLMRLARGFNLEEAFILSRATAYDKARAVYAVITHDTPSLP